MPNIDSFWKVIDNYLSFFTLNKHNKVCSINCSFCVVSWIWLRFLKFGCWNIVSDSVTNQTCLIQWFADVWGHPVKTEIPIYALNCCKTPSFQFFCWKGLENLFFCKKLHLPTMICSCCSCLWFSKKILCFKKLSKNSKIYKLK